MSDSKPEFMDPPEDCAWLPARELLHRLGYTPPPPATLDDYQLPGRLWEFIYALAGRQIYLAHTDGLNDRELYTWLHDQWFESEVADLPPQSKWTSHVDVSEFKDGLESILWLRHFASEKERADFAAKHQTAKLPPHEDPPHDRDRWLPLPPGPSPEGGSIDPLIDGEDPEDDPLGLMNVDEEIRAEHGAENGPASSGSETGRGAAMQHRRAGAGPIPPDELTDETLSAKLWEVLHQLACRGYYILNTNHLSDRELYTALWERGLCKQTTRPEKRTFNGGWFLDLVSGGSEEDTQAYLRYYADELDRYSYADDCPDEPMPPHEEPPFNRDWRLPKGLP